MHDLPGGAAAHAPPCAPVSNNWTQLECRERHVAGNITVMHAVCKLPLIVCRALLVAVAFKVAMHVAIELDRLACAVSCLLFSGV